MPRSSVSDNDSAPMEESEDERPPSPGDTSAPIFPVDNKFYSEKDKNDVLALPEVEREIILAERATILQRQQQDSALRRLYDRTREEGDKMGRKRQAEVAGIEEGGRRSTRQRKNLGGRKVGEISSSLEAYKEQRAKRSERKAISSDRKQQRRSESRSDLDADGESEVEWDTGRGKQDSASQYEMPPELPDFRRLHVDRLKFAKFCYYPTFDATVKDCYVRVAVGPDKKDGEMIHRMAKIEG